MQLIVMRFKLLVRAKPSWPFVTRRQHAHQARPVLLYIHLVRINAIYLSAARLLFVLSSSFHIPVDVVIEVAWDEPPVDTPKKGMCGRINSLSGIILHTPRPQRSLSGNWNLFLVKCSETIVRTNYMDCSN